MKNLFFIIVLLPLFSFGQSKFNLSGNEIAIMSCEFIAGNAQAWRDVVIYHPNQLFKQYPNLNRKFWDIRVQDKPGLLNTEWDADHVLKSITVASHIAAVSIKLGSGEKIKLKAIARSLILNYAAYKAGFFLSYNILNKNKL